MIREQKAVIAALFSTAAIFFMNAVFACKYLPRWSPHAEVIIGGYLSVFLIVQVFGRRIGALFSRRRLLVLCAAMAVFWIAAVQAVPAESLRLDRWQMVTGWLDKFFSGRCPYSPLPSASSHVPGPYPVLFLLTTPFYWMKEIAYFSLAGFLVYALLLTRIFRDDRGAAAWCVMNLFFSLPMQYEVLARSTLFTNMVLVLGVMYYFDRSGWQDLRHYVIGGVVSGLVLSTRSIAVIPFIIALFILLRRKRPGALRAGVLTGTAAAVFAATVLPLYLLYPEEFLLYNPFSVQSTLLPAWWMGVLLVAGACLAGWSSRTFSEVAGWSGVLLFLMMGAAFIVPVTGFGFASTLNQSRWDVSYFVLSLPFLLIMQQQALSLLQRKKNRITHADPVS